MDWFRNVGVAHIQSPTGDRHDDQERERRNQGIRSRKPRPASGCSWRRWSYMSRPRPTFGRSRSHVPRLARSPQPQQFDDRVTFCW